MILRLCLSSYLLLAAMIAGSIPAAACEPALPPGQAKAHDSGQAVQAVGLWDRSGFSHLISTGNNAYNPDCNPWLTADETELFYIIEDDMNGPPHPGYQGSWDIYVSQWDPVHQTWGPGTNLGPNINTPTGERRPSTTATGDTLFFARGGSIWISLRSGGEFGPASPLFLGSDPAITSDAQQIYYELGGDIWVADRGASIFDWTNHHALGPPVNLPGSNECRPFVSADGTKLFFSDFGGTARPGGYGGADIWVSTWNGVSWGVPENMGPPINTDRVTCTPFLTADGQRFYTASESFEGSRGDEDVWIAYLDSLPAPLLVNPPPGTWTKLGELPGAWNVYDLVADNAGVLYAATMPPGQVFRSLDAGSTWQPTASLPGAMIAYSLLLASDGSLYAGTYPNGHVFRSLDGGASWLPTGFLPASTAVRALLETSDGRILAGTSPLSHIYCTLDQGSTWLPLSVPPSISGGITTLFEASDGALFAGGWGRPSRSDDGGLTWITQDLDPHFGSHVSSIESYLETGDGALWCTGWVHSFGGYVFRTTTGGAAWDTTGRVMIDAVHAVRVYDLVEADTGELLIGYQPGPDRVACLSPDGGLTWSVEGELAGAHEILRFLKLDDGTILAATTPNGDIFRWTPTVTGAEDPGDSPADDEATGQGPGVAAVLGGSPNPFQGRTTISYQIPGTCETSLAIFDARGRHVRTLEQTVLGRGVHRTDWDGADAAGRRAASGVYFVKLRAGDSVTFQKLLLVK